MFIESNFGPLKVMRYCVCNLRILALKNFTFSHTLYAFSRDSENNKVTDVAVLSLNFPMQPAVQCMSGTLSSGVQWLGRDI